MANTMDTPETFEKIHDRLAKLNERIGKVEQRVDKILADFTPRLKEAATTEQPLEEKTPKPRRIAHPLARSSQSRVNRRYPVFSH